VLKSLAALKPTAVAHGGADGADTLANAAALMLSVPVTEYPADWKSYGPSGGPIRNARMLGEFMPDVVLAFPGGAGTADMVKRARAAGVRVVVVTP
jgi:hypothetical protein